MIIIQKKVLEILNTTFRVISHIPISNTGTCQFDA